ncbi:MAG: plasmid mobilization protein [Acidimicrobiales bacterium]
MGTTRWASRGDAPKDRGLRVRMSEAERNELARRAGAAGVSQSKYLLDAVLDKDATVSERRMWAVEMLRAEARVCRVERLLCRFLDETGLAVTEAAQAATVLEAVKKAAEAVVAMAQASSYPPSVKGRMPKPHL